MNDGIKGRPNMISNTVAQTGNWNWVSAMTDVVFAEVIGAATENGLASTFAGKTMQSGQSIRLDATSIKLTSGELWAYHT